MEQYNFKSDFTNSVFRLMGSIFIPTAIFSFIFMLLIVAVGYLLLSSEFSSYALLIQDTFEGANPEEVQAEIQALMLRFASENLFKIIPLAIVSFLISAIMYNGLYNISGSSVRNGQTSIGNAFKNLFDKRIVHLMVLMVIITVAYQILNSLVGQTGSAILGFLFAVVVGPIYYWLQLSYAFASLGEYSFGESFKLTQSEMTVSRLAKVLGIGILFGISLGVVGLIIGVLVGLLGSIPIASIIISLVSVTAFIGVIMAFIIAGYTGLFFRYSELEKSEEEFIVTD